MIYIYIHTADPDYGRSIKELGSYSKSTTETVYVYTLVKMKSYCDLLSLIITLFLLSLTTTCTAQETDSTATIVGVSVPISVIIFAVIVICVCYYGRYFRSSTPTVTAEQTQRPQYIQRPSTTQYQTQARYLSGQPYSSRTVTAPSTNLNFPPIGGGHIASNRTSQTATQATSEPVSLPEATLHQGEAPPAYTEAVKMKTVVIVDGT